MSATASETLGFIAAMLRIRRFEEELIRLGTGGAFPGHYHVYIGQEATAAAAAAWLGAGDCVFSTWRNHGHLLARGADPFRLYAEILGRAAGYCQGKGGTLHLAVAELGVPTTSALVGGNLPIAVGAAMALKQAGGDGIAVAFLGDAALEEGACYEAINLAVVWGAPVLFVCENNSVAAALRRPGQYLASTLGALHLTDVPRSLGMPAEVASGADAADLWHRFQRLVATVRRKSGPVFVEVQSDRWPGNMGLWPVLVGGPTCLAWAWAEGRPPPELAAWSETGDPLLRYVAETLRQGVLTRPEVLDLDDRVTGEIRRAAARALDSPPPPPAAAHAPVFAAGGRQPWP